MRNKNSYQEGYSKPDGTMTIGYSEFHLHFEKSAFGNFTWMSGQSAIGHYICFHRQSAIRSWISGPSATGNCIWIQTYSEFLFWIVGQPAVRKLSALAVWFGFQGNRQLGIYVDFEQSALGNSILISGQSSTGKLTWISSNWQVGILLIFVSRQSAVGNFIWILGNHQLGF